jgi:predicted transposase YdaD
MKLNEKDAKEYKRYLKGLRDIASDQHTKMADAQDLIKKGKEEKEIEAVLGFNRIGVEREKIAEALAISIEKVNQIIENQSNK